MYVGLAFSDRLGIVCSRTYVIVWSFRTARQRTQNNYVRQYMPSEVNTFAIGVDADEKVTAHRN